MRWLTIVLSFFFLSCISLPAQSVSFGGKAGAQGTSAFHGSDKRSELKSYTFGPMVEFKLPRSLAIEADLLYRRMGYTVSVPDKYGMTTSTRMRAKAWDFSGLVKYYFPGGSTRPYAAGGWALRTFSGIDGVSRLFGKDLTGAYVDRTFPARQRLGDQAGPTLGGGVQFKAKRLRIGPEVRYTRWLSLAVDIEGGRSAFYSSPNQIDVLLGLSF